MLLIQDNNEKELDEFNQDLAMAYCSIVINAGSFNNPTGRNGLAHFLEHMIFMGSVKYPDSNSFGETVGTNGGYTNAYTEFEWTTYNFNVTYAGLEHTIDVLAASFE